MIRIVAIVRVSVNVRTKVGEIRVRGYYGLGSSCSGYSLVLYICTYVCMRVRIGLLNVFPVSCVSEVL